MFINVEIGRPAGGASPGQVLDVPRLRRFVDVPHEKQATGTKDHQTLCLGNVESNI